MWVAALADGAAIFFMGLSEELADAIRETQSIQANPDGSKLTVVWSGQTLPCSAGEDKHGRKLGIGGFSDDADLILNVLVSDFSGTSYPMAQQTVIYPGSSGKKYRVDSVTNPPGAVFIQLVLVDWTKGV